MFGGVTKRIRYIGEPRDVSSNPWMRLCKDRVYDVEKTVYLDGSVHVTVREEGWGSVQLMYDSLREFYEEWRDRPERR